MVTQNRSWTYWGMYRGLADTRSHSEKKTLVDELYDCLECLAATLHPKEFDNNHIVCYVFARKI